MKADALSRRARTALVQRAIDSGRHRVEIKNDGTAVILPLGIPVAQADEAALDAEIRGHLDEHGHAPH